MRGLQNCRRRDSRGTILTSDQVIAAARHKAGNWREWRLGRVAEWSQPRYRLDGRFIGLTLLIDQGEDAVQGRWQAAEERYEDLGDLLAATPDPAIVVLGPPGGGKSTLLRRLELDTAITGLLGEGDAANRVTFFISLNTYKALRVGEPLPYPAEWLAAQWAARNPDLPSLDNLLAEGRVTLLLDALNEMPAPSEREFRERVQLWKEWLQQLVLGRPGNRVVFSCRSLDYSQSLSTPDLRVPQVRIENLTDEQVRDFLAVYSPSRWREVWTALEGSPQLEVLRSPYFLALLVEQIEASGEMPKGRAALFTGFVRQALRREVERGSPLFEPGELLESRDLRRITKWQWKGSYDLPDRGRLLPKLAELAYAMQQDRDDASGSQVRVDFDDALDLLDDEADEAIVQAGEALSVLDEDEAAGDLMYIHQLVQEYFAARELAREPDPELVRVAWRAAEIRPSVDEAIDSLDPADPLPPLPGTGWEETTILAAAMIEDPPTFLRGVMETNLALAGRAAAQPELLLRLPADLLKELRWALVARCDDAEADLRDRLACGYALGDLGDPRFERCVGPFGEYLLPPMVEIPGGTYPIGDDEPIEINPAMGMGSTDRHTPRHELEVQAFELGRFPVTNAEWAGFMAAGGYEDERWWDTEDSLAWMRGEMPNMSAMNNNRWWRWRFRTEEGLFDRFVENASFPNKEAEARALRGMEVDDETFERELAERWRGTRQREPLFWRDHRFNHPAQPVLGICWYEARAYCAWLSAQTGRGLRLPTEVEWEAAARGRHARHFAFGDDFDRLAANTHETSLKRTTPVGILPKGRTPEGIDDLTGNVFEWTSSLLGESDESGTVAFRYPYHPADWREAVDASANSQRVARGGAWIDARGSARTAYRSHEHPDYRGLNFGFRLAEE